MKKKLLKELKMHKKYIKSLTKKKLQVEYEKALNFICYKGEFINFILWEKNVINKK